MGDRRTGTADRSQGLPSFKFEKLEVFRLALEVAQLTDEVAQRHRRQRPWLASQIGRAGLSVLNNTAEASAEYSPGDKARLYRYALRSAGEVGAMIVHLGRLGLMDHDAELAARQLLQRTMSHLARTARHFQRRAERSEAPTRTK